MGRGGKVKILILKKTAKQERPQQTQIVRQQGMRRVILMEDELLIRKQRKGLITFFDMAQSNTGTVEAPVWIDWSDMQIWPPFDVTDGNPIPSIGTIALADYAYRDDAIIASDLAVRGRPVKKTERPDIFAMQIVGHNFTYNLDAAQERFTDAGFRLTPGELQSQSLSLMADSRMFDTIIFRGAGKNKVTALPDFDAETVAFDLKLGDKVYLVPKFTRTTGRARIFNNSGSPHHREYYLNYFYLLSPRDIFFNPAHPFHNYPLQGSWNNAGPMSNYPNAYWASKLNAAQIVNRINYYVEESAIWLSGGNFPPSFLGSLPPPPATPPLPPAPPSGFYAINLSANYEPQITPAGALIAVILRGTAKFYIWK